MTAVLDLLRGIPSWMRLALLGLWLLNAFVFWLLHVCGVDGIDYEAVKSGLLAFAGYLALQSGANVKADPEPPPPADPQYEIEFEE